MNWVRSAWNKSVQFLKEFPMASMTVEIGVRILLLLVFLYAEFSVSEEHVIQREEMFRYRYPYKSSKVPFRQLVIFIIAVTAAVFYAFGGRKKYHGASEYRFAVLGITCSVLITGVITNILKDVVGRPRPNYLFRCYGPTNYLHVEDADKPCNDIVLEKDIVGDLRKSFPSGHASIAFSSLVYLALYIAGKLGSFNSKGRSCMWHLLIPIIPVFIATWVAVTRYTDYHHHFDDILTGSLLGSVIAYASYRMYYPSVCEEFSQHPHKFMEHGILTPRRHEQGSVTRSSVRRQRLNARKQANNRGSEGDRVSSEPLVACLTDNDKTRSTQGLHALTLSDTSNINMDIYVSRVPSKIIGNPEVSAISRASIAFYWDDEDLDENGRPLLTPEDVDIMRQEILVALAELNRPTHRNNDENGNVNDNDE